MAAGAVGHTSGPWVVAVERVPDTNHSITYIHAADPAASPESGYRSVPFHVSRVGYAGGAESSEREAANARLVSAAPDLLAAVELAFDLVHAGHSALMADCVDCCCVQFRAAIAKAVGR